MTTPKDELLFLALGGSDEIGMNVNLYGCRGKWVMVDLGMTFSGGQYPGCDLVLPDLAFIEEHRKDLLGIVLTHGHEDHIGAIPYLAADLGVPLYATPFTAGLIRHKLEEEGLADDVKVHIVDINHAFQLGPFGFRYIPLAHSILEGNALEIETPYGRIFHTGDWKLDETPLLGVPATETQLRAIGDKGVLALVCDSTNVFNDTASGSEASVEADLLDYVRAAQGRVVVTTFASNAARLKTLAKVAVTAGRRLCVAGRSLDRILSVAQECGYLRDFPRLVDLHDAMALSAADVMIIATGGQGEERAALARMANNSHPIRLATGDMVIFSSKQIPGNEIAIGAIQNALSRKGVIMVTEKQAHVHVSGHPGRPELAKMYAWLRPELLLPVHGERRHMAEQARFGLAEGIPQALVQSNGDVVRLAPGKPAIIGHEAVGRLVLDGEVILPADGNTINERRKLALYGVITVALALDASGRVVGAPQIGVFGVPVEDERTQFINEVRTAVRTAAKSGERDETKLRDKIRLAARRVATEWTGKKPLVDVLIIQAEKR